MQHDRDRIGIGWRDVTSRDLTRLDLTKRDRTCRDISDSDSNHRHSTTFCDLHCIGRVMDHQRSDTQIFEVERELLASIARIQGYSNMGNGDR